MKLQPVAIALTVINLVILVMLLTQFNPAHAQNKTQTILPVLRGRALEIVDSAGKVRASITIQPPVAVQGKEYPETVLLRLTASNGKPMVKIGATLDGSGLTLINQSDQGVVINSRSEGNAIKITYQNKERILEP